MQQQQQRLPKRHVSGVFLLDKITGVSSNAALQRIKRIYQADKAGHTGSLDPLASGLLPICLGEATKFSQFLLDADKRYTVTGKLGERTDTFDAEGKVIASAPVAINEAQLREIINRFLGPQQQLPPMYSALKKDGKPLYELARQGIEVEREWREIVIFSCQLLAFDGASFTLDVHCSKGTYIRTLVDDIGAALGCYAHVTMLRRTAAGPFRAEQMLNSDATAELKDAQGLEAIDALLLPVDCLVQSLPKVVMPMALAHFISHGQAVLLKSAPREGQLALYDEQQRFLGVGEINADGYVAPKRLLRSE